MKRALLILLLMAGTIPPTRADENVLFTKDYFRRVGRDVVSLPGTFCRWTSKHYLLAGGILSLTAAVYSMDAETREDFGSKQTGGRHDLISRSVKPFGDYRYLGPLIAGFWVSGLATGDATLSKIAADGLEANLLATGLVTPAVSLVAGRNRPYSEKSSLDFQPLHFGRTSFPSGHTTAAFATAAVIDANLRGRFGYWQTPIVYSIAASVGLSRVYDQKHHPTDVLMGAALGSAIGYWISNKPRNQDQTLSFELEPTQAKVKLKF